MCATFASFEKAGLFVTRIPCAAKKPHFAGSASAFSARARRFSKSAHEVAINASLTDVISNDLLASSSTIDRRCPRGSSSKFELAERISFPVTESFACNSSIVAALNRRIPPSIAFNSSCVIEGEAEESSIEGTLASN